MRRLSLLKVLLNSFFIQSSWNYDRMQALGFAASMAPALKDIYGDKDLRLQSSKRHLSFFNTHPYMASPILGASIKLEERGRDGEIAGDSSARFKQAVMAPYAAMGDMFFWGSLRPFASLLGILVSLFWGLWGPVVFIVTYNVFHLWMRTRGLSKGYSMGERVTEYVKRLKLPDWSINLRYLGTAVLGGGASVALWKFLPPAGPGIWTALLVPPLVGAVALINILLKRGYSVSRLFYIVVLPLVVYGLIYYG